MLRVVFHKSYLAQFEGEFYFFPSIISIVEQGDDLTTFVRIEDVRFSKPDWLRLAPEAQDRLRLMENSWAENQSAWELRQIERA